MKHQAWRRELAAYPWQGEIAPRLTDVDTLGHLNNSSLISLHGEVRQRWQQSVLGPRSWRSREPLLRPAEITTDFLEEGHYPEPLRVGARLIAAGPQGWRLATALFQAGRCIGLQQTVMRAWGEGSQPLPLPAALTDTLARALRDPPPPEGLDPLTDGDVPAALHADADTEALRAMPLAAYPLQQTVAARYADQDLHGVTNEMALARCGEQGRMKLMGGRIEGVPAVAKLSVLVAQVRLRLLGQWAPPRAWQLGSAAGPLGRSAMPMRTVMFDAEGRIPLAVSDAVMVHIDPDSHRPTPVAEPLRTRLSMLQAETRR